MDVSNIEIAQVAIHCRVAQPSQLSVAILRQRAERLLANLASGSAHQSKRNLREAAVQIISRSEHFEQEMQVTQKEVTV